VNPQSRFDATNGHQLKIDEPGAYQKMLCVPKYAKATAAYVQVIPN
jgi:hypothetical protein